ncbi:MAG TPA: hypothetical protein EYG82_02805 [Sulfurovum sp.]|nr:hypothetical protein [Sulfurovum sp.]
MEKESRGFMGTSFKWMFIAFNIFMAVMMYLGMSSTEESSYIVKLAANMGMGMLGGMWVMGDIVLGAFTYFTRVKD